jgi:putative colanic acid biosynthesis acetyltransferase WcaF
VKTVTPIMQPQQTNPSGFRTPHTRANKVARLAWSACHALLFRPTPWFMGGWRTLLLRMWGAKIHFGRFHGSTRVWAPWLLEVGEHVYVDERVYLYNAFGIRLGDRVVISQGSLLCSATHDYRDPAYRLTGGRITVEDDCWIAAEAFVGPGVTIGRGSVVGARAVVVKDVPPWSVVAGNPARLVRELGNFDAGWRRP